MDALNKVSGSILDNEEVISKLETLKKEANVIEKDKASSDLVLLEV